MSAKKKAADPEIREAVQAAEPAAAQEPRCYIGPPALGLQPGTIYSGDLPDLLRKAIAEEPCIGKLVVPVSALPKANADRANPGSAICRFYEIARKYFKGGK